MLSARHAYATPRLGVELIEEGGASKPPHHARSMLLRRPCPRHFVPADRTDITLSHCEEVISHREITRWCGAAKFLNARNVFSHCDMGPVSH
jgi:hypothetical protein